MIALLIAAVIGAAPGASDADKLIELYMACREKPFPHPQRDVASDEAARAAYVRKQGGSTKARMEIDIACELYRLAFNDGSDYAHAAEKALSPEAKEAINREIERQFGPLRAPPLSNK